MDVKRKAHLAVFRPTRASNPPWLRRRRPPKVMPTGRIPAPAAAH